MLSNLTGDAVGTVHLIFAMVAVVSGTLVLSMKKGTTRHKRVGRIYGFSMIVMLVTAFMIYRLFGRFGTFHYTAIISVLTLAAGMVPPLFLRSNPNWLRWHFGFMYWSVIGLSSVGYLLVLGVDLGFVSGAGFPVKARTKAS